MGSKLADACAIAAYHIDSSKSAFEASMLELMDKNPAHHDYYSAILDARKQMESEDLLERLDVDYENQYSTKQAYRASVATREDVAAIKAAHFSILKRLDTLLGNQHIIHGIVEANIRAHVLTNKLSWCLVILLVYIAIRVS